MKARCNFPTATHYAYYGGRGIAVCERWLKFENFYADMGAAPSDQHSVDRINFKGNYEPGNCRWADRKTQARNTSWNNIHTIDGASRCESEWYELFGVHKTIVKLRMKKYGCSFEQALMTPGYNDYERATITAFGKTKTVHEWSKETGISLRTLKYRAASGWPGDIAVTSKPTSKKSPWKTLV